MTKTHKSNYNFLVGLIVEILSSALVVILPKCSVVLEKLQKRKLRMIPRDKEM